MKRVLPALLAFAVGAGCHHAPVAPGSTNDVAARPTIIPADQALRNIRPGRAGGGRGGLFGG